MRFQNREEKLLEIIKSTNVDIVAIAGRATDRKIKQELLDLHGEINHELNAISKELRK